MKVWWNLTKKELRLGQSAFLAVLIGFVLGAGIVSYFGDREGLVWEMMIIFCSAAVGFHIFYLAFYLLHSLSAERSKLHLWLHNPLPGYALLLAKFASGLFFMIISLMICGTLLLVAFNLSDFVQLQMSQMINVAFLGGGHIVLIGLSMAVLLTFLWMIFLVFNRSLNTFLSFGITFFTFIAMVSIYGLWIDSALYETLTSWGEIDLDVVHGLSFSLEATHVEFAAEASRMTLYVGDYVFGVIMILLLFMAASWMLDRKVEV